MSNPIQVTTDQVKYKKKIGKLDDDVVMEIGLIGGLHIVGKVKKSGAFEPLGSGPHRAVAREIARRRNPTIEYTELNKSDHIEVEHFEHLLPTYEAFTDQLIQASESE